MNPIRFSMRELLVIVAICAFVSISLVRATPIYATIFFSFTMLMIVASILMSVASIADRRAYWIGFAISSGLYMYFAHIPDIQGNAPRQYGSEFTTKLLQIGFNKLHTENYYSNIPPFGSSMPVVGKIRFNAGKSKSSATFEELIKLITTTIQPRTSTAMSDSESTLQVIHKCEIVLDSDEAQDDSIEPDVFGGPISPPPNQATQAPSAASTAMHGDGFPVDPSNFMSIGHSAFALLFGWIGGHFTCFFYHRARREVMIGTAPPKVVEVKKKVSPVAAQE